MNTFSFRLDKYVFRRWFIWFKILVKTYEVPELKVIVVDYMFFSSTLLIGSLIFKRFYCAEPIAYKTVNLTRCMCYSFFAPRMFSGCPGRWISSKKTEKYKSVEESKIYNTVTSFAFDRVYFLFFLKIYTSYLVIRSIRVHYPKVFSVFFAVAQSLIRIGPGVFPHLQSVQLGPPLLCLTKTKKNKI